MVDSAPQGEEALVAVRDVGFDLLRRHARIKSRNDDYGDIDFGKQIDGHTATVVMPTTITIRHIIRMKNGYLMAKEDITRSPPVLWHRNGAGYRPDDFPWVGNLSAPIR